MKKFFDFNGTINGNSFLLRNLFVVVFLLPFFILLFSWIIMVGMELMDSAGIDVQEIQESGTFDQKELEAQMEEGFKDNPEEILNIFKSAFTPFWIISFIISIFPVLWFSLSTYFKRITALFPKNSIYIFFGLLVTDLILDYLIFKNLLSGGNPTFKISLLLSIIIFMTLIIKDSGIEKDEHEG